MPRRRLPEAKPGQPITAEFMNERDRLIYSATDKFPSAAPRKHPHFVVARLTTHIEEEGDRSGSSANPGAATGVRQVWNPTTGQFQDMSGAAINDRGYAYHHRKQEYVIFDKEC